MKLWTLDELVTKIRKDHEIESEVDAVPPDMLLGYINDAIDNAERLIHDENQDYFLAKSTITPDSGASEIAWPTDIWSTKIRKMVYNNTSDSNTYKVTRIPLDEISDVESQDDYRYRIFNNLATGIQLCLYPDFRGDGSFTMYYSRNARRLAEDDDVCDLGEFVDYIFAYVGVQIVLKIDPALLENARLDLLDAKTKLIKANHSLTDDGEGTELNIESEYYQ